MFGHLIMYTTGVSTMVTLGKARLGPRDSPGRLESTGFGARCRDCVANDTVGRGPGNVAGK